MNKKTVDITKKNNVKCEHCSFWIDSGKEDGKICCNKESKHYLNPRQYYNCCKKFKWHEKYLKKTGD